MDGEPGTRSGSPGPQAHPGLRGLRLVIDPGHGGPDPGHSPSPHGTEAAWTLDVATRMAQICETAGATVAVTRSGDAFVPRACRRAYVQELRPDVALSLHVGPPHDHGTAGVHWGGAWWQRSRVHGLARRTQGALERRTTVRGLPRAGRRIGRCWAPGGGWQTLTLLVVARPAADGGGLDPGVWAESLADGLAAFHATSARGPWPQAWQGKATADQTPPPIRSAQRLPVAPSEPPTRGLVEASEGPRAVREDPVPGGTPPPIPDSVARAETVPRKEPESRREPEPQQDHASSMDESSPVADEGQAAPPQGSPPASEPEPPPTGAAPTPPAREPDAETQPVAPAAETPAATDADVPPHPDAQGHGARRHRRARPDHPGAPPLIPGVRQEFSIVPGGPRLLSVVPPTANVASMRAMPPSDYAESAPDGRPAKG